VHIKENPFQILLKKKPLSDFTQQRKTHESNTFVIQYRIKNPLPDSPHNLIQNFQNAINAAETVKN
jgi:hypothetical protein